MNNQRRNDLRAIIAKIAAAAKEIESIRDDEAECRDNIPENLRMSDRYEKADDAVCALDDACLAFDELFDHLECAIE